MTLNKHLKGGRAQLNSSTSTRVVCTYMSVCLNVCVTHDSTSLCDEEEFRESSVKRKQHSDTSGILAQAVLHGHEEPPERS